MSTQPLPCPHCRAELDLGLGACAACGLRLRGPQAQRLWQVDQQLAALNHERSGLIGALLAPEPAVPVGAPYQPAAAGPGGGGHWPQQPKRSTPTGQQLLLAVGALLLLSAATFVGVVVWMVVGVWGQAVLLCLMTALSVVGANMATRRGLPAAAETGALLASGLTVIGLWAAWSLDLAGLQQGSGSWYATIAATLAAALVLLYDRLVPRLAADGAPARRMVSYRPLATTFAAFATWSLLVALSPEGIWLVLGLAGVTALNAGLRTGAERLGLGEAAAAVPAFNMFAAGAAYLAVGLAQAHDVTYGGREWTALLMLATAVSLGVMAPRLQARIPSSLLAPVVAVIAVVALWALTWEAHWALLLAAAVLTALAAVGLAHAPLTDSVRQSVGHRCAQVAVAVLGVGLFLMLFVLNRDDEPQLVHSSGGVGPSLALVVGVGVLWSIAATAVAVRLRSLLWLLLGQGLLLAAVFMGLVDAEPETAVLVWMAVATFLAGVMAALDLTGWGRRPERRGWAFVVGMAALLAGVMAIAAAVDLTQSWLGWTFLALGVLLHAVSLLPGRLPAAYASAPVISLGTWLLADQQGYTAVETWSWPLAGVLAIIGWRHWRQDRAVRTRLSMGPALSAAYVPSLLVAIGGGDALRLGLVTLAGVLLLVMGLVLRWQAPVAVGVVGLVLVAITQGGPYIAILPGWFTLGLAGAVLLAIGVSWERAVLAGRRGSAWFETLR